MRKRTMPKYKCVIAYDGTDFAGYQVQPEKRTIQSEFEAVLAQMHKGTIIKVTASGRTDSGVHAKGQVLHFESPLTFPTENWIKAFSALLPTDIIALEVDIVPDDFHARFHTTGKEYRYIVARSKLRDPFKRNYAYHYPYPLNVEAMREAISYLIGTHDFTSFCSAKTEVVDKVRTIKEMDFEESDDFLVFRFVGEGFLYNMVRILVGTLLDVGSGKMSPHDMSGILDKKDRSFAGKTAPAQGLYLWKVFYK
ncbi:tRNA pseudouridine(38-40) synthase TruA [Peribacillus frigoritolerans]|uniref:tRNA pseudouridine synthase A n=3 Tax=Bacillaceae TaxID=186817 RepID=A0AAW9NID9_9BACI|nr:tRNA pseudouridine(38-40) synthase TruA [Peribacillus frigoritolerans]MEC0274357.1 tRNA pseudouridine(38-40) synthase TruA [Peribacillus castrilensis]MCK2020931.1 tRNA pseudouridine(38-40) synthase TruA [Peribacillus frigoritolerans]MCY8939014.1 tRNA pseudouridine(38-40) synthase TruA [Peribacillus frigoritolerans]MEC0299618.1 tRNA pseudouridine(38-40) synthase TruA [Peribacillus castrilensis]MEC0347804.1 tRNA pseudouridine(38-40) synthase TruA [Peribacillus castrilensis]